MSCRKGVRSRRDLDTVPLQAIEIHENTESPNLSLAANSHYKSNRPDASFERSTNSQVPWHLDIIRERSLAPSQRL